MMSEPFTQDAIREFVIAGHGNLPKVREMLEANPALLNVTYQWGENDFEAAVQAAAHVGSVPVAEYLLGKGAPLAICTAATLGRTDTIREMLDHDPAQITERGAHQIPLLAHAAFSGKPDLIAMLIERGASEGISFALGNAVTAGHVEVVRWLLVHTKPDLSWQNYEGKTPLDIADERGFTEIVELLQG